MIGLHHWFRKGGYDWVVIKRRELRNHFAVLDQKNLQLIFDDIVSIGTTVPSFPMPTPALILEVKGEISLVFL